MKLGVVIPVGPGREENLTLVLHHLLEQQIPVEHVVLVLDGPATKDPLMEDNAMECIRIPKHEPGMEQPRNVGVRAMMASRPDVTHVAFLDSDVIVGPTWHTEIISAYAENDQQERIMVCPYDWLLKGCRYIAEGLRNDPRWNRFRETSPGVVWADDISAGLACFSGNLIWPITEFSRVGGFWCEIYHGRCEDGELGLRAVAMGVPISFAPKARGWHLWHPINTAMAKERNKRDVPMLNDRHPWVEGAQVFMVDRDGKAFDVRCSGCGESVPTNEWWDHSEICGVSSELPTEV